MRYCLFLGLIVPCLCQDLVENGSFQTDLSSWDQYNGVVAWSEESVDVGSGSALLTNDSGQKGLEILFQCVPIDPLGEYQIDFSTMVPSGQDNTGHGQMVMYLYGGNSCSGVPVGSGGLGASSETGSWHTDTIQLTAPATASSLILRLTVRKDDETKPLSVLFDGIKVQQVGSIPDYPKPQCDQLRMLPHITSLTGGFSTQVILKNFGSVAGRVDLYAYRSDGTHFQNHSYTLNPFETRFLDANTAFSENPSHILVSQNAPIFVSCAYRGVTEGSPVYIQESCGGVYQFSVRPTNWAISFDGLALVNEGEDPADISITQYNAAGESVQTMYLIDFDKHPAQFEKVLVVLNDYFVQDDNSYFVVESSELISYVTISGTYLGQEPSILWQNNATDLAY